MVFIWNKHRFSGGALIFDLVNTVVRRLDPQRREDRLIDNVATARFASAALAFRREDICSRRTDYEVNQAEHALLLEMREAAYRFFMPSSRREVSDNADLANLLGLISKALSLSPAMPFATDVAMSALSQIKPDQQMRLKACPNCDWLFLDKSKNGSRIWCDMAVCGNRQKARRHYLKRSSKVDGVEAHP
jgi:predicted RNA-binding Zn ribbon-like protein